MSLLSNTDTNEPSAFLFIIIKLNGASLYPQASNSTLYFLPFSKCIISSILFLLEKIFDELPDQDVEATSDTADTANAASAELKNASIQFYVSTTLKEHIDKKADSLSMDTAQFLRIAALAEQPVYVLEKGHYIVRYLIEMYDLANDALLDQKLDNKYGQIIQRKIQDILDLFVKISKRLTNVNSIEGAADEED